MKYIVEGFQRVPKSDLLPDGKITLREKPFPSLHAAVQAADRFIEKAPAPSTVVEVRERTGAIKYRAERTPNGSITKTPLV